MTTSSYAKYQQWHNNDKKTRFFSAALAVLITFFLSLQYTYQSNKIIRNEALHQSLTIFILPTNRPPQIKEVVQTSTKKPIQTNISNSHTQSTSIKVVQTSAITETSPSQQTESTEPPTTLRSMSSQEMLHIYNASKSEIQQMAESSGKKLNTPVKSRYDRFQEAAENAAIPDCLSPQKPNGMGLFALPVIIFAASTGKCK